MITVGFIATMAREATLSRHNNAIEGRAAATGDGYSGRTANGIVNVGGQTRTIHMCISVYVHLSPKGCP